MATQHRTYTCTSSLGIAATSLRVDPSIPGQPLARSTRQVSLTGSQRTFDVRLPQVLLNKPLLQTPHTREVGRRGLRHGGLYGVRRSRTAGR